MKHPDESLIFQIFCVSATFLYLASYGLYAQDISDGILETHTYPSTVSGPSAKKMYVYLPAGYHVGHARYPVVYFLHGANGNERSWMDKGLILSCIDSLETCGEIPPAIYVFPNTNRYDNEYDYIGSRPRRSVDAYMDLNGSAEYSFIHDIMKYVDENLRTIPEKRYRAIAGLSLGGLQTLYITSNVPDAFGYVGLFSPIIYPPMSIGRYSHIYRNLPDKLEIQFGSSPSLYLIMIGEDDPYYRSAFIFSESLRQERYDFRFISTPGGHTWDNWKSYSLYFLKSLWDSPQGDASR